MKKAGLILSFTTILAVSATISNNVSAKEKHKTTLPETMEWIKSKINSDANFGGSCDNNATLEGKMKVTSIEGCTMVVQETISKVMGGFSQTKVKTFNLKTINPNSINLSNNVISGCWFNKETNPYFLNLTSNGPKDIRVSLTDYAKNTQESYYTNTENIFFNTQDMADRNVKAITYAIKLCKDNEPF